MKAWLLLILTIVTLWRPIYQFDNGEVMILDNWSSDENSFIQTLDVWTPINNSRLLLLNEGKIVAWQTLEVTVE